MRALHHDLRSGIEALFDVTIRLPSHQKPSSPGWGQAAVARMRRRSQAGQAVLEFAVVMPFVLVLLFFFAEGVRMMNTWSAMELASREGARVGAVRKPQADIVTATVNRSGGALTAANVTV